jgi:hypothetical protein
MPRDNLRSTVSNQSFPTIQAVEWIPASQVLGGEASDFTPWLQQPSILEILGRTLKLEDLTAIATEHNVLGKRLDILASATDEAGEEVAVCIENQYGQSDASHLGRLIAYLAQHERGRAVWIVESAHEAYVAAVRFLNRTSVEDVGYYLVRVLLTHGANGSFQVHFDVLAAPLAWERRGKGSGGGAKPVNASKVAFLGAVTELASPKLTAAGFSVRNPHARGAYTHIKWPDQLWISDFSNGLDIRITRRQATVAVYLTAFGTNEENSRAADVLRDQIESHLAAALPPNSTVDWEIGGSGRRKPIAVRLEGGGFLEGDTSATATWSAAVCRAWAYVLATHRIDDLEAAVGSEVAATSLDDDPYELAQDDGI